METAARHQLAPQKQLAESSKLSNTQRQENTPDHEMKKHGPNQLKTTRQLSDHLDHLSPKTPLISCRIAAGPAVQAA